jgi:hypothetical protein
MPKKWHMIKIKEDNANEIRIYNHLCIIGGRDTGIL